PIGVGKASDLGDDIAIVADTSFLTLNYLENVWQNTKYS
ncbi:beta-phosphoglucomutase, partial [Kingella kingae]|nr:beta-phosphoglucomutase [Kingella kingae]